MTTSAVAGDFQRYEPVFDSTEHDQITRKLGPQPFSFTGSGSEYFRIWIVNLLLSIITLGIYSAWAKVRRNRYFYDSTHVAGSSFEYHGNPIAILKGRIIAFVCLAAYQFSFRYSPLLGLSVFGILMLIMPWLAWKSLQFKLYNSSYRGIRFGFRGSLGKAYLNFLLYPILAAISLYTLLPLMHRQIKKFQHEESRFGNTHFSFVAKISSFYLIYIIGFAAFMVGLIGIGVVAGSAIFTMFSENAGAKPDADSMKSFMYAIGAIYVWMFCLAPLFFTMTQNLIWSNTRLGEHRFTCKMHLGRVIFIMFTNVIGVICTLGLFIPFAHIRTLKYRLESMTLIPNDDLDNFVAHEQQQTSATGEGMADMFDFDLSM